ncbi:LysR family transcriptional regulator [bacterium]|nr:LysR family transcriptional regulator [candidate division CSSED10-310 bacterium]
MNVFIRRKISLEDLYLFELLTTTGSISGVAQRTDLTQPAITQKLNRLEKQVGALLWIRRGRSMGEPSEAGKRFLHYTRTVLRETMDLLTDLGIINQDRVIHIGASSVPSEHLLPRMIALYQETSQSEEMRVVLAGSRKICILVENGTLDAGFTGFIMPGFTGRSEVIARDSIVAVVSPDSDIARENRELTFRDLSSLPFVTRESESGTRSVLEEVLHAHGIVFPSRCKIHEVGGTHALIQAIREGLGFSFISSFNTRDLHVVRIRDLPTIQRSFYILYRSDVMLDRKVSQFIEYVRNYFGSANRSEE